MVRNARFAGKKLFELAERLKAETFKVAVNLVVAKSEGKGENFLTAQGLLGVAVDERKLIFSA